MEVEQEVQVQVEVEVEGLHKIFMFHKMYHVKSVSKENNFKEGKGH